MVANGDRDAIDRTVRQFHADDNMTDRLAALSILTGSALPERVAALEAFRERYRGNPLVLDKWLSLEAMTPAPETLDRVKALRDDPAFTMANPNRVRSLFGAFATGNQTQFNRPDGAGYDFFADFIVDYDTRNPQIAARLLTAFRSWRALEEHRRAQAEKALRRIAAAPNLSRDVDDIVTRTLA
jgi:aminopeptidase N